MGTKQLTIPGMKFGSMYSLEKDSNIDADFFFTFVNPGSIERGITVPVCYGNETNMVMSLGIIAALAGEINGAKFLEGFTSKEELIAGNKLQKIQTGSGYRTNFAKLWIGGKVPRTLYNDVFYTYDGDVQFSYDNEERHFVLGHRFRRDDDFVDRLFLDLEMIPILADALTEPDSKVGERYYLPARAIANMIRDLWRPE